MTSNKTSVDRRGFLKKVATGAAALAGSVPAAMAQQTQLAQGRGAGQAAPANATGSYAMTEGRIRHNRCTTHRRDPFDAGPRRIMHRTQIKDKARPASRNCATTSATELPFCGDIASTCRRTVSMLMPSVSAIVATENLIVI